MLMKEDEGKQGFVAAKRQCFLYLLSHLFYTCFIFASVPLLAASLNSLINPGFNN
jgi:hypothetical protein